MKAIEEREIVFRREQIIIIIVKYKCPKCDAILTDYNYDQPYKYTVESVYCKHCDENFEVPNA